MKSVEQSTRCGEGGEARIVCAGVDLAEQVIHVHTVGAAEAARVIVAGARTRL